MVEHIYEIIEEMYEELEGAEEYAHRAMECKDPQKKAMYLDMASDELHHFEKLGEMLMSHSHIGEELKQYIVLKHEAMLKKHAYIKYLISSAK